MEVIDERLLAVHTAVQVEKVVSPKRFLEYRWDRFNPQDPVFDDINTGIFKSFYLIAEHSIREELYPYKRRFYDACDGGIYRPISQRSRLTDQATTLGDAIGLDGVRLDYFTNLFTAQTQSHLRINFVDRFRFLGHLSSDFDPQKVREREHFAEKTKEERIRRDADSMAYTHGVNWMDCLNALHKVRIFAYGLSGIFYYDEFDPLSTKRFIEERRRELMEETAVLDIVDARIARAARLN